MLITVNLQIKTSVSLLGHVVLAPSRPPVKAEHERFGRRRLAEVGAEGAGHHLSHQGLAEQMPFRQLCCEKLTDDKFRKR